MNFKYLFVIDSPLIEKGFKIFIINNFFSNLLLKFVDKING